MPDTFAPYVRYVFRTERKWTQRFWRWLVGHVLDPVDAITLQRLVKRSVR